MRRKVRILILKPAQDSSSPVSGANSTSFRRDDKESVRRPGSIAFLRKLKPAVKGLDDIQAVYFLSRDGPDNVVIIPEAEKHRGQDEDGDYWKLPAASEVDQQAAGTDPGSSGQKQDRAHPQPVRHRNGIYGEDDKKQQRAYQHNTHCHDRIPPQVSEMFDLPRRCCAN